MVATPHLYLVEFRDGGMQAYGNSLLAVELLQHQEAMLHTLIGNIAKYVVCLCHHMHKYDMG